MPVSLFLEFQPIPQGAIALHFAQVLLFLCFRGVLHSLLELVDFLFEEDVVYIEFLVFFMEFQDTILFFLVQFQNSLF